MKTRKAVTDLGTAAYLLMKEFTVVGRKGKEIYFELARDNNERKFDLLTLDYLCSEFHRFDSCIMALKKIGDMDYSDPSRSRFVTDLGAAAYLLMYKFKVVGRRGKSFYFDTEDEDRFDQIALEYLSSDYHKFDSCLMSLKKIHEYLAD